MSIFNKLFGRTRRTGSSQNKISTTEASVQEAIQYYDRGVQLMHSDDWEKALDALVKSAELNPESALCWYALGISYGKNTPNNADENEMRKFTNKICSSFEKAVDLSDTDGSLEQQHYLTACISAGTFYRVDKQYDSAINLFKRGLVKVPDDADLLESLALCFIAKGDLDPAEKTVEELLKVTPSSERGRKLWKKVRKEQGKLLTVDMPEDRRKEIYAGYMSTVDSEFLLNSNILEDTNKAENLRDMGQALGKNSEKSRVIAEKNTLATYKISPFELQLILKEGRRNTWPFQSITQLGGDKPAPQKEQFRDTLQCTNCGKRNIASFWPEGGDTTGFYFQSEERTREKQGEFRLPMACPHCNQTWYVVWDSSPDPLAGQFIRHLERMCEAHASNDLAVKAFRDMIDDRIIGEHVEFIKKELRNAGPPTQNFEHSVTVDSYFSNLTIVPAADPQNIRSHLGGSYFGYMERILPGADMDQRHTVHWIFAVDDVNVGVHMTFLPIKSQVSVLPNILPVDLLTPQERAQVGL